MTPDELGCTPAMLDLLKRRLCHQLWRAQEARAWGAVTFVTFKEDEVVWRLGHA